MTDDRDMTIPRARVPEETVDIWDLPEPEPVPGSFKADWSSLSEYRVPDWFREGKLGFWSHWDPQSVPEEGDWYARWMYVEGHKDNLYHKEHYGTLDRFGYKDICGLFSASAFDPDDLIRLVRSAGGKYFLSLANHHDNFDNFDSRYQPWNSVNVGAFQDIVGRWTEAARKAGLHVGVSYHATPGRVWGQFMPVRYKRDVPGDGLLTKADGEGRWWEGLDPKDLYGPEHDADDDPLTSPFIPQFLHRVNDLMKYRPELICFDESVGNLRDLGVKLGFGLNVLSPRLLSDYYNSCEKLGIEGVMTMKDIGGMYDSVGDPMLMPVLHQAFVNGIEKGTEEEIADYPFQTEESLAEWHYQKGMRYKSAAEILTELSDTVSRNGNLVVCIPQHGDGSVDEAGRSLCEAIGRWLEVNGEAIYGTRPFEVYGEENGVRYTRKPGFVYAILTEPVSGDVVLEALGSRSVTLGEAVGVRLLGNGGSVGFTQTEEKMTVRLPAPEGDGLPRVLIIESRKKYINDDDAGIVYDGWYHRYERGSGNFNSDLHIAKRLGAAAVMEIRGSELVIYAEKGPRFGALEIRIDGKFCGTAFLHSRETVKSCRVFEKKLPFGPHRLEIISAQAAPANLDAVAVL